VSRQQAVALFRGGLDVLIITVMVSIRELRAVHFDAISSAVDAAVRGTMSQSFFGVSYREGRQQRASRPQLGSAMWAGAIDLPFRGSAKSAST
jgi:hypothetical protein